MIEQTWYDRHKNIKWKKSGKLRVIEVFAVKNKRGDKTAMCKCRCKCGNLCVARKDHIVCKSRKSCGCAFKQIHNKHNLTSVVVRKIEEKSRRYGYECNITYKYIKDLFRKQKGLCKLSGVPIYCYTQQQCKKFNLEVTASIDRIDSTKGYIKGNVQWVHKHINFMKLELSQSDFINWCKAVVSYNTNYKIDIGPLALTKMGGKKDRK